MWNMIAGAAMKAGGNLASRAGTTGQMGLGYWQIQQAKKMKAKLGDRPTYQTPEALTGARDKFKEVISSAQNRVAEGLPYAVRKQFEDQMNQATASGLRFAGKRARGLAGLKDIFTSRQQGQETLLTASAQATQEAMKDVEATKLASVDLERDIAEHESQAYFINQLDPYMQKEGEIQAMMGAGMQNLWGGFKEQAVNTDEDLQEAGDSMMSMPGGGGGGMV